MSAVVALEGGAVRDGPISLTIAQEYIAGPDPVPPSAINPGPHGTPVPCPGAAYITLLAGTLREWEQYAGAEHSAWLLDMAHDICDPGHKRGMLFVFAAGAWQAVTPTAPLVAGNYTYVLPQGITIGLTEIIDRERSSKTSTTGEPASMRARVLHRDNSTCWISLQDFPVTNSHIVPKRMGDQLAGAVLSVFCGLPASGRSVSDTIFALSLNALQDPLFSPFDMGFRHVSGETYNVHLFAHRDLWTQYGVPPVGVSANAWLYPPLHGRQVTPPSPGHVENPPLGLFRWHYVQCVIKKFGHEDYKGRPSIKYSVLPMRMKGDSDDEGTDDEADWPSAAWDRGRLAHAQQVEDQQRQQDVSAWLAASR